MNSAVRITFSRKVRKEPVADDDDTEEKADYVRLFELYST